MPPKRQFGKYLWDPNAEVPVRSKYRFKQRLSLGAPSSSTIVSGSRGGSSSDSSSGSDNEDVPRCAPEVAATDSSEESSFESSPEGDVADLPCTADAVANVDCVEVDGIDQYNQFSRDPTGSQASSDDSTDSEREPGIERDPTDGETSSDDSTDSECEPGIDSSHREQQFTEPGADELDEPLFPGARLTRAESFLMVMAHSLRYNSSKEATGSLVQLINAHLPEGVPYPTSKYTFFRHFCGAEKQYVKHFYCSACTGYIGELQAGNVLCVHCHVEHTVQGLTNSSSFFLVLDLKSQLCELLESGCIRRDGPGLSYDVQDITQSNQYHKLSVAQDDVTLTFNTDGVPLYDSSKVGIWPLLVMVNEIPYKQRIEKLMLAALWFGPKKPNMNCFLIPFVKTMNELSSTGVVWRDNSGVSHVSKAYPGPCTVDTIARRDVMNMTQFNGAQGCAWCEDEGKVMPKGKGTCRVYVPTGSAPKLRTHDSFVSHARKARPGAPSCGVMGVSVLTLLTFFKFGTGFVVDYMHSVCLGFVKSTMTVWRKSRKCRKFKFRTHLDDANDCLLSLTGVWELSRLPRSLHESKYWKASDWRNWMLFYSPIVLKGRIPKPHYDHWMKFVEMLHYLLGPCVSIENIINMQKEMMKFLVEYKDFYGEEYMTYNAHLLLHLVDSVKNWGPLWGYSLFPFESMNGTLGRFVNGTRYAHLQIVEKFSILKNLSNLWSLRSARNGPCCLASSFKSLIKGYNLRKKIFKVGSVLLLGRGVRKENVTEFQKMVIGPFKFCTGRLDKSRRKNSYVNGNGVFGRISRIVVQDGPPAASSNAVRVELQIFTVTQRLFSSISRGMALEFVQVQETADSCIVNARCLNKCIFLTDTESMFLCLLHDNLVLESV